jgi:hypothetical protein
MYFLNERQAVAKALGIFGGEAKPETVRWKFRRAWLEDPNVGDEKQLQRRRRYLHTRGIDNSVANRRNMWKRVRWLRHMAKAMYLALTAEDNDRINGLQDSWYSRSLRPKSALLRKFLFPLFGTSTPSPLFCLRDQQLKAPSYFSPKPILILTSM